MFLLHGSAPLRHLQEGHLKRNTHNNCYPRCAYMKIKIQCYQLLKCTKNRLITGILHLWIILCLVADKHLCHYWHLLYKGVIFVLMFIIELFNLVWINWMHNKSINQSNYCKWLPWRWPIGAECRRNITK
jgi:hypothetical protein